MGAAWSFLLDDPELECPECAHVFTNPNKRYTKIVHSTEGHSFIHKDGIGSMWVGRGTSFHKAKL